jgi:hypothetical protein
VVMDLRQRATLRARIALRERVIAVAVYRCDFVGLDFDEDAADGRAYPAEAPDYGHDADRTRRQRYRRGDFLNNALLGRV